MVHPRQNFGHYAAKAKQTGTSSHISAKKGSQPEKSCNQASQVIWVFTKRPLGLGFMGIYVKFYEVYGKVKRKQKLTASEMAPMIGGIVFYLVILGVFWEYFVHYGYFHIVKILAALF